MVMKKYRLILILVVIQLLVSLLATSACIAPVPEQSPPQENIPTKYNSVVPLDPDWSHPSVREEVGTGLSIPEIVKKASPSVVAIHTEVVTFNIFLQPVPRQGAGTGIIIDEEGYIVTNNHVVEDAEKVRVTLTDGRTFDVSQIARDPRTDLAVIKIEGDNIRPAELGDSESLLVGEDVIAIGNALALDGGPTVTSGIVSYVGRSIQEPNGAVLYNLIQTDAAINPGNSGGPLLNIEGRVIGINTAIAVGAENIGFAISIVPALPIIEQLIQKGYVAWPWLGVGLQTVTPQISVYYDLKVDEGVIITTLVPDSPASRAGLQVGDIIIRFGGQEMNDTDELIKAIRAHRIGDRIEIVYVRGESEQSTWALLGESPPP